MLVSVVFHNRIVLGRKDLRKLSVLVRGERNMFADLVVGPIPIFRDVGGTSAVRYAGDIPETILQNSTSL